MSWSVDFTAVDALAAALVAGGVRSASVNVAEVNTPGVLVQVVDVDPATLGGGVSIGLRLVCIVAETDARRALDGLADLANLVLGVLDPSGPIAAASIALPSAPTTGLPALVIPFTLHL